MLDVVTREDLDALTQKHPLVVLDFWGPKCGPCLKLAPILESLEKLVPGVVFAKAQVNHKTEELCDIFTVASIPTIAVIVRGECKDKIVGNDVDAILRSIVTQYTAVYDV